MYRIPKKKRRIVNSKYEWCITKRKVNVNLYIHNIESDTSLSIKIKGDLQEITPYQSPTWEISQELITLLNTKDLNNEYIGKK